MPTTDANGIEIYYERHGEGDRDVVLLIAGLGEQLTSWPMELVEALAERGFDVARFDNRDVGLSGKFEGSPNVMKALVTGKAPEPPYTLDDMADDAVAVLDDLGVSQAHVVGASMGGMIAQTVAIRHPDRVASLVSIGSSTGNPNLPPGRPEVFQALLAPPAPADQPEAVVERGLETWRALAGPDYRVPENQRREWLLRDFHRSYYPSGFARQLYAIVAHGDRREGLRNLDVPTVVLHGTADPLIRKEAGEDTAATIPDAELRLVEGWGHNLPLEIVPTVADAITDAARR